MGVNEKLNLRDLAQLLASVKELSLQEAEKFLNEMFALISDSVLENEVVKIKNFGTFKVTQVQARESIDVNSGEKIEIPAHNRLIFTPATSLKEAVNKPFAHFETILLNEGVTFDSVSAEEENEIEINDQDYPEEPQPIVEQEQIDQSEIVIAPDLVETIDEALIHENGGFEAHPIANPDVISTPPTYPKKHKSTRPVRRYKKNNSIILFILAGIIVATTAAAFFFQGNSSDE